MKKSIKILTCVLVIALTLVGIFSVAGASSSIPSETNPFGENHYIDATNQSAPFFDVILPKIQKNIKANNKHSISPAFDSLPVANNPENFQGLGSTSYANINGKTVTVEGFYRVSTDSLHDPNAGMGLLIYQCIKYKQANPTEDVRITFSTYRTSATAAVCVLPESKYYGYMRSLYTTNYDEHGFVRISFMMAEAARMGIEVVLVNQLPSYSVQQYNPATKKNESRKILSYETYFQKAMATDCYNKYAAGKKVSDYMTCETVEWTVSDKTTDMQHVKSCTVSHYIANNGKVHKNGVFFTSSNLDENNYLGRNGNGYSQSGIIISDHSELYRIVNNYTNLMLQYTGKEEIQEFRKVIMDMNAQQYALIKAGKESQIPSDEQIVYLGGAKDPVFELTFTPLTGAVDAWDTEYNPVCEHIDKLVASEGYIELAVNNYGTEANYLRAALEDKLEKAFCQNKNAKNKISVQAPDMTLDKIASLKVGSEIGARNLKFNGKTNKMHAKDFLMSYEEDGIRHNVSIITSCNYVTQEFHHRTNFILVIDETGATGGNFYGIMTPKYSAGTIK